MSEIPYFFETPVPKYFRESGWFDNENTYKFVHWAFARCSTQPHKIIMDSKEITLSPFEFIAGRLTSSKECFLTEKQFRGQLNSLLDAGLLKKGANSRANRFTTYVWVTERFWKNNVQQKGQLRANSGPTKGHNQDDKNIRHKNDHHPYPSSKALSTGGASDGLTDDFFLIENLKTHSEKMKQDKVEKTLPFFQHNSNYQADDHPTTPVEVYPGVFISKGDLEQCIKIKGSLESVQHAIEYIMRSPGRKRKIYNWPNALSTWEIKTNIKPRLKENEEMGQRLEQEYSNVPGWCCNVHTDRKKDQKGILFYNSTSTGNSEPIFIAFVDPEFKEKTSKVLRDKRMQKGRISKS